MHTDAGQYPDLPHPFTYQATVVRTAQETHIFAPSPPLSFSATATNDPDLQKQLDQLKKKSDEVELDWTEAAEKLEEFDQQH